MATENVNMNIENTTTSASAQGDATVTPSSGSVQLTPEMLSSAQVSVNMKFLADIRNVLDLATQRGAWRANELTAVGSLVDSLDNAFRQLASKTSEVAAAAAASSEGSNERSTESSSEGSRASDSANNSSSGSSVNSITL